MSGQILDPYDVPLSAINKSNVSISISIIRNVTLLLWFCSEKAYTGSTYNGSINTMNKILHIQNTGASVNVYTRTGGELLSQWLVGARVAALSTSGNFTRTFSAIHTGQWKKKQMLLWECALKRERSDEYYYCEHLINQNPSQFEADGLHQQKTTAAENIHLRLQMCRLRADITSLNPSTDRPCVCVCQ